MNSGPSNSLPWRQGFLLGAAIVALLLATLFFKAVYPDYVVFSNDGPLGGMMAEQNQVPEIITGLWQDLNWLGGSYPAPAPNLTLVFRCLTSPLVLSKLGAAFSLFVVGLCAWFCFRQYRFSPFACLLVAVATALNSDFFGTACWGVWQQPIAFGMNFLALGALADTTSPRRWLRVVLAGFAVGLGVMEAYDIGALFSLFVAAFVVAQSLVSDGPVLQRLATGMGRLAVVGACAGFIAAAALLTLVGTQVKGVAGMGQDAESKAARWSQATLASLPKKETLGILVPGLFGFRGDTPEGGAYWGTAGSDPAWDRFLESDRKGPPPGGSLHGGMGSNYAGVVVVLLAAFGVAQSLRRQGGPFSPEQRRLVWFWCAVVVVGLLLMFGRFAPFYQFFYALPYASTIRNPAKFLHLVEWALLILFAYGAEALWRVGLQSPTSASGGLRAHWKSWWAKAAGFNRAWVLGSLVALAVFGLAWLLYASSRGALAQHLAAMTNYQAAAQGRKPDPVAVEQAAQATARFSVGQVQRTLLFLVPTVALVAVTLSGYFAGRRARFGGALFLVLLVADLLPVAQEWVVMVNWQEKYESNPIIEFLRERPYEHRVAIFPLERFVDTRRLPPEIAQAYGFFAQWYGIEWTQHLFQYYNIQALDIIQEPRVATDKAAYESVMLPAPLRRWELSNTRYLLGPTSMLDFLNQQFDPGRNRFRLATTFDLAAKPGTSGQRLEQITTTIHTNGRLAVFAFTGALPRAKLYANWKVSTNDATRLQEWVQGIQPRVPSEWASALAAQSTADLATLHELADPAFDPAQTVLLAEPLAAPPGPNQNPGAVQFERYAPKHLALTAQATAPCVLLLNDKYDPNWHVTVDGQPARLLRCNFIVRGVFLDKAGDHRVEFQYQPPLTGLYVSLAAAVLGLGLLGYVIVTERRRDQPAAAKPPTGKK